ncbi:solute carrier family 4 member 11-like isoform X2 [Eriocheir sinensis]|uniref:solute carrier family 4 member 11-like isoform X2 n=1 Tax=Eriocheir sinensis TaxID=95602 RepID=UPI0021C8D623|nr:solute carrier family 4 member 11-like isoform X2 [Eriocheir sinensis]
MARGGAPWVGRGSTRSEWVTGVRAGARGRRVRGAGGGRRAAASVVQSVAREGCGRPAPVGEDGVASEMVLRAAVSAAPPGAPPRPPGPPPPAGPTQPLPSSSTSPKTSPLPPRSELPRLPPPPSSPSPSSGRRSPASSPHSPLLARTRGSSSLTPAPAVPTPASSAPAKLGTGGPGRGGPSHPPRAPRPLPPPHRLIRQHSLAAVLGLFRGREERGGSGGAAGMAEEWPPVREEQESEELEEERCSSANNSRSHSIPSTSVPHLPQEARRKRRSSCHTDPCGLVVALPPPPHAIKKKPLTSEAVAAAAAATRRCSLTLPYAALYGSWQSTASAPGSRHGSSEMPPGGAGINRRAAAPSVAVEMTSMGAGGGQGAANSCSVSQSPAVPPTSTPMTTSSSTAPLLPSPPPEMGHSAPLRPVSEAMTNLLASSQQKVPMKDFGSEVRASMDIAHFLSQATLVLDVAETSLEGICDLLLTKLLEQDEPLCSVAEAKSILFTHDTLHLLARTIQGTATSENGSFDYDQSWICALGNLPSLQRRHVAIARLKQPANMGRTSKQVKLFILVLCPSKEKGTKNSLETGRTFATIFADMDFRQRLLEATNEEEFKRLIIKHSQELAEEQQVTNDKRIEMNHERVEEFEYQEKRCSFARGLREDLERRLPHYLSDYKDGVVGHKTLQKVISTTFFLYFACILPAIAFGVLNDHNTHGRIDVKKVIIGQVIGGVFWGVFSGQPLLIQLTTAPLAIYIKIIFYICNDFKLDFHAMYCAVGLWNSFFLVMYSLFDVSRLMRWSTRSTEEIFALFISIAFCNDAFTAVRKNFDANYYSPSCQKGANTSFVAAVSPSIYAATGNQSEPFISYTSTSHGEVEEGNVTFTLVQELCTRENSILYLLLMFGTLWLGVMLYNFNKTPYLNANKREALADYALPVAVIVLSFIGSYVFRDVKLEHFRYDNSYDMFQLPPLDALPIPAVFATMGLGFSLSMLFFMDQNIGSAMVNNPCNKLKKGPAYHLDLLVVAFMNGFLSVFCLPWMHACLPHSPLHVRSLADVEERVEQGHVYEIIVKVRETRLTGLFSNILIGLSIFLLPYPLAYIPTAVLDGLFLYMAVTALNGNQMFERITLLFMEQAAYPPNHYIRRVPQRKIHKFTGLQVVQLLVMCSLGFAPWPYLKMMFPVALLLLLPIRHKLVPMVIEDKYLAALDGEHQ